MVSSYPTYDKSIKESVDVINAEKIIDIISKARNIKRENNIGKEYLILCNLNEEELILFNNNIDIFNKLLKGEIVSSIDNNYKRVDVVLSFGTITLGYLGNDNSEEIIQSLLKEKEQLLINIERRTKLLSNQGYVNKAPKNIVDEEKSKLEEERNSLIIIENKIKEN